MCLLADARVIGSAGLFRKGYFVPPGAILPLLPPLISFDSISNPKYRHHCDRLANNSRPPFLRRGVSAPLGKPERTGPTFAISRNSLNFDRRRPAILGEIAIKFDATPFEEAWRGGASDIIVTDLSDIILVSYREDCPWRWPVMPPRGYPAPTSVP